MVALLKPTKPEEEVGVGVGVGEGEGDEKSQEWDVTTVMNGTGLAADVWARGRVVDRWWLEEVGGH